tara:strand:+ start:1654 stop:2079 length:426 start_codon:yes stop_codon:yes gene_type:complete
MSDSTRVLFIKIFALLMIAVGLNGVLFATMMGITAFLYSKEQSLAILFIFNALSFLFFMVASFAVYDLKAKTLVFYKWLIRINVIIYSVFILYFYFFIDVSFTALDSRINLGLYILAMMVSYLYYFLGYIMLNKNAKFFIR